MSKADQRYLARFCCSWCNQPLDRDSCGALFEACDQATREKRRAECLAARGKRKLEKHHEQV